MQDFCQNVRLPCNTCWVTFDPKIDIHLQWGQLIITRSPYFPSVQLRLTLHFHLGQQLVQHHHLATVHHQVEIGGVRWAWLSPIKQVGMVAALPQLHEDVQQAHLVHFSSRVQDVDVLHENLCVPGGVLHVNKQQL